MAGAEVEEEAGIPKKIESTEEVLIKCQCWVRKDEEERLAEILSINARVSPSKFYVHYVNFNKRLDEWVTGDRINLDKEVIFPRPKRQLEEDTNKKQKKKKKFPQKAAVVESDAKSSEMGEGSDVMDLDNLNVRGLKDEEISREDEIKKLRTSGSMIQNPHEVAHVRNLSKIIMGKFEIEPWYFSPYPIELTDLDVVYIDDFTLQYFGSRKQY